MSEQNPLEKNLFKLGRLIVSTKPVIIKELGLKALEFASDNFRDEAFHGATTQKWAQRKKKDKGPRRAILVQNSDLIGSLKANERQDTVVISTDIPYAKAHNEGLTLAIPSRSVILNYKGKKGGKLKLAKVRTELQQRSIKTIRRAQINGYTVKMPERRFIGPSPVYDRMAQKSIEEIILKKIKQL